MKKLEVCGRVLWKFLLCRNVEVFCDVRGFKKDLIFSGAELPLSV